jgi:hypothetical protein
MNAVPEERLRVFVIWERVLASDWAPPANSVLARIPDPRAAQFWDRERTLSRSMGEKDGDRQSIVWDWVAVYKPGARWTAALPEPAFSGRPVADVAEKLTESVRRNLVGN